MFTMTTQKAFSFLEIVVVLSILIIVAAVLLPVLSSARIRTQDSACVSNLKSITLAMDMYKTDFDGQFPMLKTGNIINLHVPENSREWNVLVQPYLRHTVFPICPLRKMAFVNLQGNELAASDFSGYAMNLNLNTRQGTLLDHKWNGIAEASLRSPASTITLFEARSGIYCGSRPDRVSTWEELNLNYGIRIGIQSFPDFLQQVPGALRHHGGAHYTFADGHVKWLPPPAICIEPTSDGITPGFGI